MPRTKRLKTWIIEETATYCVKATSAEEAEDKFLKAISINKRSGIITDSINAREVYFDPEQRLTSKKG